MKRIVSFLLAAVMLIALSASAFADAGNYTLYMDRNGKVVQDASGTKIGGRLQEKIFQKFYKLMQNVPVNWDKFDYASYEVTVGEDGSVTFGKQTMGALDGSTVISGDAEIVIFETPKNFHAVNSGETTITHFDFYGEELDVSQVSVKAISTGAKLLSNICPKCGQDQGKGFHLMVCGHYSCQVGEVGHGAGACGVPGHMNCDGLDHSPCSNCLKPLCSGAHGVGVCEHVHNWQFAGAAFSPDRKYWVTRIYCPGCGVYSFNAEELPKPECKPTEKPDKPEEKLPE